MKRNMKFEFCDCATAAIIQFFFFFSLSSQQSPPQSDLRAQSRGIRLSIASSNQVRRYYKFIILEAI
jgi:hypothetical protein